MIQIIEALGKKSCYFFLKFPFGGMKDENRSWSQRPQMKTFARTRHLFMSSCVENLKHIGKWAQNQNDSR